MNVSEVHTIEDNGFVRAPNFKVFKRGDVVFIIMNARSKRKQRRIYEKKLQVCRQYTFMLLQYLQIHKLHGDIAS
jgi:hypothetical protein